MVGLFDNVGTYIHILSNSVYVWKFTLHLQHTPL